MRESRKDMLSFGAFLIILVIAILLVATQTISLFWAIPVVLVLSGCWVLALAFMPGSKAQQNYPTGAFGKMGLGLVLIALGGAWYLSTINWLYAIALILFVLGSIAIAAALRRR